MAGIPAGAVRGVAGRIPLEHFDLSVIHILEKFADTPLYPANLTVGQPELDGCVRPSHAAAAVEVRPWGYRYERRAADLELHQHLEEVAQPFGRDRAQAIDRAAWQSLHPNVLPVSAAVAALALERDTVVN